MKKKIKIAAGFLTVIFCILLGCERREKEAETLFLEENGSVSVDGERSADESAREEGVSSPEAEASAREASGEIPEAGNEVMENAGEEPAGSEACVVHICGAVNEPGVYTLDVGSRIYQAVREAGGFREDAQQDYLNQADLLFDGMKIYVPTQEEAAGAQEGAGWEAVSGGAGTDPGKGAAKGAGTEDPGNGGAGSLPVNINTAGEEQLCTLPGVGSSKARSIIAYREQNGAYRRIEDIMNVEGIKDGVFQKIKDSITV